MDVANRKILIVGGGSGMGFALARLCLDAGARIVIAGRSGARLDRARAGLGHADRLEAVMGDIASEEQGAALFAQVGQLDHIVCTAADISGAYRLLPQLERAAVQQVIDSKFYGPLWLAKHGEPVLSGAGSLTFNAGLSVLS